MSDKMREQIADLIALHVSGPNVHYLPATDAAEHRQDQLRAADAIMALAAIPTTDAGGSEEIASVVRWIDQCIERAQKHGNTEGLWLFASQWRTVRNALSASPTPSTDVGEDEETRLSNIIGTVLYRSALNGTAAEIDRTTDEIIAAIRKEARP